MIKLQDLMAIIKSPNHSSWQGWRIYNKETGYSIPVLDALDKEVESCEILEDSIKVIVK